jgi:hypothetical protein
MNPRGSIVCPSRPVDIGGGVMVSGRKPGIIVYTKAGSGRLMRKFERFCHQNGIDARPVQDVTDTGRPHAWECVGTLESLEALTEHEAVADWHLIVSVRVPLCSGGSGEVTERVRKAINRSRLHRPDREAAEENDRRARLPKDERERIDLAELQERERVLAS